MIQQVLATPTLESAFTKPVLVHHLAAGTSNTQSQVRIIRICPTVQCHYSYAYMHVAQWLNAAAVYLTANGFLLIHVFDVCRPARNSCAS